MLYTGVYMWYIRQHFCSKILRQERKLDHNRFYLRNYLNIINLSTFYS